MQEGRGAARSFVWLGGALRGAVGARRGAAACLAAAPGVQVGVVEDASFLQHCTLLDAVKGRVLGCGVAAGWQGKIAETGPWCPGIGVQELQRCRLLLHARKPGAFAPDRRGAATDPCSPQPAAHSRTRPGPRPFSPAPCAAGRCCLAPWLPSSLWGAPGLPRSLGMASCPQIEAIWTRVVLQWEWEARPCPPPCAPRSCPWVGLGPGRRSGPTVWAQSGFEECGDSHKR